MYICPVLLYRCYLSVYSPFLLIVEVHWVACLMPVCGEVGLKPCASCVLTRMLWVFYKSRGEKKKTDNQMYKTCLVSNRPATSSSYTLGIITPKSLVTALVSLGLCEINTHTHIHKKKEPFWFLTSAHEAQAQPLTSLSTNGEFHHAKPSLQYQKRLFAMCTV